MVNSKDYSVIGTRLLGLVKLEVQLALNMNTLLQRRAGHDGVIDGPSCATPLP